MTDEQWLTEAGLAERMGGDVTPQQVAAWRLAYGWPSLKIGRQHRYTPAHVAEIERMQEHRGGRPSKAAATALPGQTKRSARRSA